MEPDSELFEELVIGSSRPARGLADSVLTAARARLRRRWALLGASASVLAMAIALTMVLGTSGGGAPAGAIAPKASNTVAHDTAADESGPIYVAVLRYALPAPGGPVWILTHTVSDIVESDGSGTSSLIGSDVRAQIAAALTYPVHWVDKSPVRGLDNPEHGTVVTLGPIEDLHSEVHVAIETWCGGLCAEGKTLVLRQVSGVWRVVGTTGPEWIS